MFAVCKGRSSIRLQIHGYLFLDGVPDLFASTKALRKRAGIPDDFFVLVCHELFEFLIFPYFGENDMIVEV